MTGKHLKEEKLRMLNLSKVKFMCTCGRKVIIPYWVDKQMCSWCGHWVYRDKKEEFNDKLKTALLKAKRKDMIENDRTRKFSTRDSNRFDSISKQPTKITKI